MRTIILAGLLVSSIASASAAPGDVADRHGIASIVPKNWTLLPPEPNLNGTRFMSPDQDSWLALYKAPASRSTAAHMEAVAFRNGEKITYLKRGRGWIVVSGFKGDRIFYRKAMLACANADWHHLWFEYPAEEKRAFDRLVTRTSHSLKMHTNDGCGPASAQR